MAAVNGLARKKKKKKRRKNENRAGRSDPRRSRLQTSERLYTVRTEKIISFGQQAKWKNLT